MGSPKKTHCQRGHPMIPSNIRLSMRRGLPQRRCRACQRQAQLIRAKRLGAKKYTGNISMEKARGMLLALREGKTLNQITSNGEGPNRLGVHSYQWAMFCRNNRQVGRMAERLAKKNRILSFARPTRAMKLMAAPTIVVARGLDVLTAIRAAVPEWWDAERREEVISRLGVAIAEGRVKPHEISARVDEFATAHARMFTQYAPTGGKWFSLDAPLYDDSGITLGDTITRGFWD
jgi:hypothetical protein